MRARAVLDAIDDALVIASRAPVLFARMSRAGCSVVDLSLAYDMHVGGLPSRWVAFLDAPGTARRTYKRRAKASAVRVARRRNRR